MSGEVTCVTRIWEYIKTNLYHRKQTDEYLEEIKVSPADTDLPHYTGGKEGEKKPRVIPTIVTRCLHETRARDGCLHSYRAALYTTPSLGLQSPTRTTGWGKTHTGRYRIESHTWTSTERKCSVWTIIMSDSLSNQTDNLPPSLVSFCYTILYRHKDIKDNFLAGESIHHDDDKQTILTEWVHVTTLHAPTCITGQCQETIQTNVLYRCVCMARGMLIIPFPYKLLLREC